MTNGDELSALVMNVLAIDSLWLPEKTKFTEY